MQSQLTRKYKEVTNNFQAEKIRDRLLSPAQLEDDKVDEPEEPVEEHENPMPFGPPQGQHLLQIEDPYIYPDQHSESQIAG